MSDYFYVSLNLVAVPNVKILITFVTQLLELVLSLLLNLEAVNIISSLKRKYCVKALVLIIIGHFPFTVSFKSLKGTIKTLAVKMKSSHLLRTDIKQEYYSASFTVQVCSKKVKVISIFVF